MQSNKYQFQWTFISILMKLRIVRDNHVKLQKQTEKNKFNCKRETNKQYLITPKKSDRNYLSPTNLIIARKNIFWM